jgi:plastocyanin
MPMRFLRAVVVVSTIGITLGACGSSSSKSTTATSLTTTSPSPSTTAPSTTAPSTAGTAITIQGFKFSPASLQAKVGDTITVTNQDGTNHTVTAVDGTFDTGAFDSGSKTFSVTKAGTFDYHCNIHNFMTGVIKVST